MQKHSALLVLGMGLLGPMRAANSERCGELHYARLAGDGLLAYRCSDESCWLRKPAVSDKPKRGAGGAHRFSARSGSA